MEMKTKTGEIQTPEVNVPKTEGTAKAPETESKTAKGMKAPTNTVEEKSSEPTQTKTRTRIRSIEELAELPVSRMNEQEKKKYIDHLRDEVCSQDNTIELLQKNCDSAYAKVRQLESQMEETSLKAKAKLEYAKQSVQHALTSIILAGGIEK